jgi:hypothetical protein
MVGQKVCEDHGGRAAQNLNAAQLRVAEERAKNALVRLGLPPCVNALEALQEHAAIMIAWRDKCAELLNRLDPDKLRYEGKLAGEQLRAEVGMFERAMSECTRALASLGRLNIDERLAVIEERKADLLAGALAGALAEAQLPEDQAGEVRREFARRLRVVPGTMIPRSA